MDVRLGVLAVGCNAPPPIDLLPDITAVGHALGSVVSLLLATFFLIGLCARAVHAWNNRDPRAAGERRQIERRARVAVRRVAEDVPLHGAPRHQADDPDPALPFDRQEDA